MNNWDGLMEECVAQAKQREESEILEISEATGLSVEELTKGFNEFESQKFCGSFV